MKTEFTKEREMWKRVQEKKIVHHFLEGKKL